MPAEQSAGRDDAVLPQMPEQQSCQAVITARSVQCGFGQMACRAQDRELMPQHQDPVSMAMSLSARSANHAEQPNHEQVAKIYEHEC
jgi:hypothetical protein